MTRVINLLGADISSDLLRPVAGDNDRGYWESRAVYEIHDQLLYALGSAYDDPRPLPENWDQTSAADDVHRLLVAEIRKDFEESCLFVVKDPRIARLLPLWLKILDHLRIEPVILIMVRNPLEVIASLEQRNRDSIRAQSILVYLRSYMELEFYSRGRQRLFVRYDQLLNDWRKVAKRLNRKTVARFSALSTQNVEQIEGFLTLDLYHNRSDQSELRAAPDTPRMLIEMYCRMCKAADGADDMRLRRFFDRTRRAANESTKLFRGLGSDQLGDDREMAPEYASQRRKFRSDAARLWLCLKSAQSRSEELESTLQVTGERLARLCNNLTVLASKADSLQLEHDFEKWKAALGNDHAA
jgi:hypothetical protein